MMDAANDIAVPPRQAFDIVVLSQLPGYDQASLVEIIGARRTRLLNAQPVIEISPPGFAANEAVLNAPPSKPKLILERGGAYPLITVRLASLLVDDIIDIWEADSVANLTIDPNVTVKIEKTDTIRKIIERLTSAIPAGQSRVFRIRHTRTGFAASPMSDPLVVTNPGSGTPAISSVTRTSLLTALTQTFAVAYTNASNSLIEFQEDDNAGYASPATQQQTVSGSGTVNFSVTRTNGYTGYARARIAGGSWVSGGSFTINTGSGGGTNPDLAAPTLFELVGFDTAGKPLFNLAFTSTGTAALAVGDDPEIDIRAVGGSYTTYANDISADELLDGYGTGFGFPVLANGNYEARARNVRGGSGGPYSSVITFLRDTQPALTLTRTTGVGVLSNVVFRVAVASGDIGTLGQAIDLSIFTNAAGTGSPAFFASGTVTAQNITDGFKDITVPGPLLASTTYYPFVQRQNGTLYSGASFQLGSVARFGSTAEGFSGGSPKSGTLSLFGAATGRFVTAFVSVYGEPDIGVDTVTLGGVADTPDFSYEGGGFRVGMQVHHLAAASGTTLTHNYSSTQVGTTYGSSIHLTSHNGGTVLSSAALAQPTLTNTPEGVEMTVPPGALMLAVFQTNDPVPATVNHAWSDPVGAVTLTGEGPVQTNIGVMISAFYENTGATSKQVKPRLTLQPDFTMGQVTATAGQTVFTYNALLSSEFKVRVRRTRASVLTQLSYPTDYTVTGVGNGGGGTIVLTAGAQAGDLIDIDAPNFVGGRLGCAVIGA